MAGATTDMAALSAMAQALLRSTEALAALVALMRIQDEGLAPDVRVTRALDRVVRALGVDPSTLVELPREQRHALQALARSVMRQAAELMDDPARAATWSSSDPVLLQSQGRASAGIARLIHAAAPTLPGLAEALAREGAAFLDVGTGVGWLAITFAERFPAARVVGIDTWKASLALAQRNVAAADLDARVALRLQDVANLDERGAYDAAFLPGPFLPEAVVPRAVARCREALRPGAWLFWGVYPAIDDPLAQAVTDLRVVRSGAAPLRAWEVSAMLADAGFADARALDGGDDAPACLVAARRPG